MKGPGLSNRYFAWRVGSNWLGFVLCSLSLLFAALGLFFIRVQHVGTVLGDATGCTGCFESAVFWQDGPIVSAVIVLFFLSFFTRSRWTGMLFRAIAIMTLLLYALDMLIFDQFSMRLRLDDLLIYGTQTHLLWDHLAQTLSSFSLPLVIGFSLFWLTVLLVGQWKKVVSITMVPLRIRLALYGIPVALLFVGAIVQPRTAYVHDWALVNFISFNVHQSAAVDYSASYKDELLQKPVLEVQCVQGRGWRGDIVVLILESWSPYQSQLWSGINDWTPNLDRLATEYIAFEQFHASGFTTNHGLISLLGGLDFILPVERPTALMPFATAWNVEQSLAEELNAQGYQTAFLTSGDLSFSEKDRWLINQGFNHIEGHDYPGYADHPRLHFRSVPDDILYARATEYVIESFEHAQPLLVVVESVSSHHPHVHPYTRERSQESVFRFMDETAYGFYERLKREGFFDHGVMVIVSDHRAMLPISVAEQDRFGRAASSLTPAIVIANDAPSAWVEDIYHQADLVPSLLRQVSETYCSRQPVRDMLQPDQTEPRCVFHVRGDDRARIEVFCPAGTGTVHVSGDNTRFVHAEGLSVSHQQALLNEINLQRIVRMQAEHAYQPEE